MDAVFRGEHEEHGLAEAHGHLGRMEFEFLRADPHFRRCLGRQARGGEGQWHAQHHQEPALHAQLRVTGSSTKLTFVPTVTSRVPRSAWAGS